MITAVDTNILLDLLVAAARHADASERLLDEAARAGAVVISEAVYAELAAAFPGFADLEQFLRDTGIRLEPSGSSALHRAGRAWRRYSDRRPRTLTCPQCGNKDSVTCSRCGRSLAPRQHVLADFLIGAHALVHADQLLTRDRGYYRTYFADLAVGAS